MGNFASSLMFELTRRLPTRMMPNSSRNGLCVMSGEFFIVVIHVRGRRCNTTTHLLEGQHTLINNGYDSGNGYILEFPFD